MSNSNCVFLPPPSNHYEQSSPDSREFEKGEAVCVKISSIYPIVYGRYIGPYTPSIGAPSANYHHRVFFDGRMQNLTKYQVCKTRIDKKKVHRILTNAFPEENPHTGEVQGKYSGHSTELQGFSQNVFKYLGGKRKGRHTRKGKKSHKKSRKHTRKH